jgi:hypothetical protein
MDKKKNILPHKVAQAQNRNKFFRQIEQICSLVGGNEIFHLIPRKDLEVMYIRRLLPFKVTAASGSDIPQNVVNTIRDFLPALMKDAHIPLFKDGPTILLYDFFSAGFSLVIYLRRLTIHNYPEAGRVLQALTPFRSYAEETGDSEESLKNFLQVIGDTMCNYTSRLYWLTHKVTSKTVGTMGLQYVIEVHASVPPRIPITIDGKTRSVMNLCWGFPGTGVDTVTIDPEEIGLHNAHPGTRYGIFVQMHALKRLSERLDCMSIDLLHINLYQSVKRPKAFKDVHGTVYIEYRLFKTKLGYLKATIQDEKIIIRTFLFLTNNGTPEGDKLLEICGLGKLDKTYLLLDKLSSFMNTQLGSYAELRALFEQAGCQSLLDAYNAIGRLATKKTEETAIQRMMKYLGLDTQEDFLTTLLESEQ